MLDPNKRNYGPSSNMGLKGLVNFASGIKTGEIVTGEEAAKDLIDNRLIVSIDPGIVNLAAITFAFGCYNSSTTSFDGQFAKKLISAKSVSRDTSLTITLIAPTNPTNSPTS